MTDREPEACTGAVLFTDLVGFTEFNEAVGDVAALAVLDAQTELARAAIGQHRKGRIVKELGDGLMLWFETAADGLEAAEAFLDSIDIARAEGAFPLAVRMGLHYGPAIPRGDDMIGQTVNIASRLSDIAAPGELLVSDVAIEALAPAPPPPVCAIGPVTVKGVSMPIWIHCVERKQPEVI